jgi:hypothetical protein
MPRIVTSYVTKSASPVDWLAAVLRDSARRRRLLLVGIGEVMLAFLLPLMLAARSGNIGVLQNTGTLFNAAAIVLSILTIPHVTRLAGGAPIMWTVRDRRGFGFLWRFTALMLAALLLFMLYKTYLDSIASLVTPQNPYQGMQRPIGEASGGTWVVGLGLLVVWPPSVFLLILAQAGVLVLVLMPLAWLVRKNH